ncbi:hypothetical protein NFI96_023726 [Prochilodus magdalenae]|nr:hypothetical protein NFI96_023726 [Prochilodus magdalenae]
MAEGGSYIDSEKFKCPICLDLMKAPVTIPCGHSYCMACIARCWDKGDSTGVHVCPQCRQKFVPRPKLAKNALLAEVVEKLREERKSSTTAQPEGPEGAGGAGEAGGVDVRCDVCIGAKSRAIRSCLVCLASYCEQHLQPHYESPAFKTHRLVSAAGRLQDRICSQHGKLLEFYCQTDKLCVCYVCMFGEHRGHNVVSAETERATKKVQKQVAAAQQSSQQKIRTREKELKELKQTVGAYRHPVKTAVSESCLVRDSLVKAVKQWQADLEKLIRAEESRAVSAAQAVVAQQEQVLADLKKRDAELQQLFKSDDHIRFLKGFEALCEAAPESCWDRPVAASTTVSGVRERLETFCSTELTAFSRRGEWEICLAPVKEFLILSCLPDACHLTLDPNTANGHLELNHEERSVTCDASCFCPGEDKCNRTPRPYPPHPDRFDYQLQVLCRESLFGGRFYWEVEAAPLRGYVVVCYGSIPRKENSFLDDFINSRKSWCVECGNEFPFILRYGAYRVAKYLETLELDDDTQDEAKRKIKLGVFLDHSAGILSFYVVNKEEMIHIYTFRTTFTEPLYVGLRPAHDGPKQRS